jgi:hypothetical protein
MAPQAAAESKGVRGLLITGRRDSSLEAMIRALCEQTGFHVDWRTYRLALTLD